MRDVISNKIVLPLTGSASSAGTTGAPSCAGGAWDMAADADARNADSLATDILATLEFLVRTDRRRRVEVGSGLGWV